MQTDHNCNFPSQRGQLSYCKCNNSSEDITSDSHYLIQLNSILAQAEVTVSVRLSESVVQEFSDWSFCILCFVVLQVRCFYPTRSNFLSGNCNSIIVPLSFSIGFHFSLSDKHLKFYFKDPQKKRQMIRTKQVIKFSKNKHSCNATKCSSYLDYCISCIHSFHALLFADFDLLNSWFSWCLMNLEIYCHWQWYSLHSLSSL